MFQLIEGASIPGAETLEEAFQEQDGWLRANVSAERLQELFRRFIEQDGSNLYSLWLEQPVKFEEEGGASRRMIKVYTMDGLFADDARHMLELFGALLLQDGLVHFGLTSERGNELGKYRYGEICAYSHPGDLRMLRKLFASMGIPETSKLKGPWELIHAGNPGRSDPIRIDGRTVQDAIEAMGELGLGLIERREE